jgi:hypothetical protein
METHLLKSRLGLKLLGPLLIITVASLIGAAIVIMVSYNHQLTLTERFEYQTAEQTAATVDYFFEHIEAGLAANARLIGSQPPTSAQSLPLLQTTAQQFPALHRLTHLDQAGQEISSVVDLEPTAVSVQSQQETPAFRAAINGESYIGPPETVSAGFEVIPFAVPILDDQNQPVGVLRADLRLETLTEHIREAEPTDG